MTKDFFKRYAISTLGLIVVALGVGVSIKSNLGIAPLSCVPTILSLKFTGISVGTFTWMFNLTFICIQACILGKNIKWDILIQLIPIFIFGYLVDGAIWLFDSLNAPATNYILQILLSLAAVVLTAIGIRLEVIGQGWMLSVDGTINLISRTTGAKFSYVKVGIDVLMVVITAVLALIFFGLLTGNGSTVVIREGTLIQAIFTGLCMKLTDPVVDSIFLPRKKG